MSNKFFQIIAAVLIVILLGGGVALSVVVSRQHKTEKSAQTQIISLQKQLTDLQQKLGVVTSDQKTLTDQETANRQVIHEKSQDELLTAAVAKVTPSVVSIVISKDVPNLQVTYENPFGNDPMFKDFGIQVPVYTQNGTTHQQVGAGSGFIITTDGYILTNRHVVEDQSADYTVLLSSGKQLPAKVIYIDPNLDAAIVKIDGKYPAVTLGDSTSLKLGQSVIAIGNALGQYNNSVSVGIVSGLNRTIQAADNNGATEQLTGIIQTDAAINPGNSGGPMLDLNGNVVGINVATVVGSSNISFAIPINTIKSIIKQALGR